MNQYDSELKMYGDSGLRTLEDWATRGRDIQLDSKSRVDAVHRGHPVALYSRNQTNARAGRTQK